MSGSVRPQVQEDAEIVDFDEALLQACPAELRAELISEANLLAQAFAPEGRPAQLEAMAVALTRGAQSPDMDRGRARRLAAALRALARESER
ncbi:hypothetical protein [Phenylobacterium deserti]|uniref:Uncharacterized protein n=1 Tax=Phenylobacterium deserti TaxID=1914756 RepID=A0A328AFD1_9CAUL|nr:hypothetical protein [Phenylobacterium deserti]RAK52826.1 hypothetical protein DJ018_11630 [Phenylobacterium deserti]